MNPLVLRQPIILTFMLYVVVGIHRGYWQENGALPENEEQELRG